MCLLELIKMEKESLFGIEIIDGIKDGISGNQEMDF